MNGLLDYIENNNEVFIDIIIDILKDDKDLLIEIGVSESETKQKKIIPSLIREIITNPENKESIDELIKLLITDYDLGDYEKVPLIIHEVSADAYSAKRSLYVYKCSELYFCYFIDEQMETLITEDPEEFCFQAAYSIIDSYELEIGNLDDEWFKESDTSNELLQNFEFNKA